MSFSENLHYLRKRDKITQEELADRLGVTRQSVSKWETGEASPETDKLILLCDLFHVTLDDIVRGDLTVGTEVVEISTEEPQTQEYGREFVSQINKFSGKIALGVLLVLLGVAVCVLLNGIAECFSGAAQELTSIMGGVAVVLFVAAAIFLFVSSGLEYDRFRKEHPQINNVYDDSARKAFAKKFATAMACLVSGILLDVVFLIVFTALIESGVIAAANSEAATSFVVSAFLCALSVIVSGLVYFGIQHTKYNVSEYNRQNNEEKENNPKRKKMSDAICGTIMLTATAIFLLIGFVWHLWHPGWIVFPVGGIICAIVSTIMGMKN